MREGICENLSIAEVQCGKDRGGDKSIAEDHQGFSLFFVKINHKRALLCLVSETKLRGKAT